MPAALIYCLVTSYYRTLLWTPAPFNNLNKFAEIASYELFDLPIWCVASAVVLMAVYAIRGNGENSLRRVMAVLSALLFALLAAQVLEAAITFSICYGGPTEGCTPEVITSFRGIAYVVAGAWALSALFFERLLNGVFRHFGLLI